MSAQGHLLQRLVAIKLVSRELMKEGYWVSISVLRSIQTHSRNWCDTNPLLAGLPCCSLAGFEWLAANSLQVPRSIILILEPLIDLSLGDDSTIAILHDNEAATEVSFGDDD